MAKTKNKQPLLQSDEIVEKPVEQPQQEQPLVLIGDQIIIGCGGSLKIGKEYNVSADVAMNLIKKGIAKLKK